MTQLELAEAASLSRATVALIEKGKSDPRISTIVELANALSISPLFLITGASHAAALLQLADGSLEKEPPLSQSEVDRMSHFLRSGMLKDRVRAAAVGSTVSRSRRPSLRAAIGAAIFTPFKPGNGTIVGAIIGDASTPDGGPSHELEQRGPQG